jgi:hypothetical protein
MLRGIAIAPILIGMATVAELGFGLRHASTLATLANLALVKEPDRS